MIEELLKDIGGWGPRLAERNAVVGFDGFVDTLVRLVRRRNGTGVEIFESIADFGAYLMDRTGSSCSIEMKEITTKPGGNMPNLAAALGGFGIKVDGVGTLGYPEVRSVFEALPRTCTLHSYGAPGSTLALEFDNGKAMLYTMPSENLDWPVLISRIGEQTLLPLLANAHLLCAVNWAEIESSTSIWQSFFDLARRQPGKQERIALVDLSDCTRRAPDEITAVLSLLEHASRSLRLVLSLNENEARYVRDVIAPGRRGADLVNVGGAISDSLPRATLVLHPHDRAMAWTEGSFCDMHTRFIRKPALSTGGGDTFNAGLSAGLLLGLSLESCLVVANASASFYVELGRCPTLQELSAHIGRYREEFEASSP